MVIKLSADLEDRIRNNVTVHDHIQIRLSDGTKLSSRIWLPKDALSTPVPAILEYLPYPKQDMTAVRDALNHPFFAAHGYACVRVDMRGAGNSEGVLKGEYLKQEQDDALEILRWITNQKWCTGSIGMIGISWGGFNGLQIAARQPPELKAVISICSTDDRYDTDIHYMGGCMLVEQFLWASSMLTINASPPEPELLGENWRDVWMKRLQEGGQYMEEWHRHQRRDQFYKHASICEDYSNVQVPVFLVGGWMDSYHKSIFRMLANLKCPKKGLVGPWAHLYPNFAIPGPQIGFLQEAVRFWDYWLKGKETGIMDDPMLQCYLMDTAPPKTHYGKRLGRWVAEKSWPSENTHVRLLRMEPNRLVKESSGRDKHVSICSPQTAGFASHRWLVFGKGHDAPSDQRRDEGQSLVFDSEVLKKSFDLLGSISVKLRVSSDQKNALVAAVVSEILPNGSATRLSLGLLNLTHRESHLDVRDLVPGEFYNVQINLDECGQRLSAGSRLRLALSSAFFPTVWPSPTPVTLTFDLAHCSIALPLRTESPLDRELKPFEPPVNGPPLQLTQLREPHSTDVINYDLSNDTTTLLIDHDDGMFEIVDNKWQYGVSERIKASIKPNDPSSAQVERSFRNEFGRSGSALIVDGVTKMHMTTTEMHLYASLRAFEGTEQVFGRENTYVIPRDHV